MPRKLDNGTYEFKGGCIGEKDASGKYKLVSARKRRNKNSKKPKKNSIKKPIKKSLNKSVKKDGKTIDKEGTKIIKKRRSQKKQFTNKPQKGGNKRGLDITVSMLRDFYANNM